MLELSLFGQIPASRHDQVLKILAGVAAMPPQRTAERHLLFKPARPTVRNVVQVGGSQGVQDAQKAARQAQTNTDLFFLRLVEDLVVNGGIVGKEGDGDVEMAEGEGQGGKWTLQFYDVPEPGKRLVTARQSFVTEILDGDAVEFTIELGYQFVQQYIIEGHQVVHNNTVLHLHRILQLPEDLAQQSNLPRSSIGDIHTLIPLDGSGGYTLQATVRVQEGSTPDVMARGTSELVNLKELLKGSIDLRMVDRLSLDTRVK